MQPKIEIQIVTNSTDQFDMNCDAKLKRNLNLGKYIEKMNKTRSVHIIRKKKEKEINVSYTKQK